MEGVWLRSFPCIALRVLTVHDLLRHKCALTTLARPGSNSFPMRLSSPEKRIIIYFYTSMGTYLFFPNIFYLPFILFLFKELEKKHSKKLLLETRYSRRWNHDLENMLVRKVLSQFCLMLRPSAINLLVNCSFLSIFYIYYIVSRFALSMCFLFLRLVA